MKWLGLLVPVVFLMASCALNDELDAPIQADFFSAFDFRDGAQDWSGDFSDYPVGYEDSLELEFKYDYFPIGSGFEGKTISLSGKNPHRDLFYFIKRKVGGLKPETTYLLEYDIHFLISILDGDSDISGDVYVKAGGLETEPLLSASQEGSAFDIKSQELNLDIGSKPSLTGQDVITIGRVEMPLLRESKLYNASSVGQQFIATTDIHGEYWLIIGFDSSVNAHLAFYFSRINVFYSEM